MNLTRLLNKLSRPKAFAREIAEFYEGKLHFSFNGREYKALGTYPTFSAYPNSGYITYMEHERIVDPDNPKFANQPDDYPGEYVPVKIKFEEVLKEHLEREFDKGWDDFVNYIFDSQEQNEQIKRLTQRRSRLNNALNEVDDADAIHKEVIISVLRSYLHRFDEETHDIALPETSDSRLRFESAIGANILRGCADLRRGLVYLGLIPDKPFVTLRNINDLFSYEGKARINNPPEKILWLKSKVALNNFIKLLKNKNKIHRIKPPQHQTIQNLFIYQNDPSWDFKGLENSSGKYAEYDRLEILVDNLGKL